MVFETFGASVTGPSHVTSGRPCEDVFQIGHSADQLWTCAVVCDGCGSSSMALEGAKVISTGVLNGLLSLTEELGQLGPGDWLIDRIVVHLASLREDMRNDLDGPIRDYSATVVAALLSSRGGFILHIGDGIASAFSITTTDATNKSLEIVAQSSPENGEYINQTFYLTGSDWIHHVRVTPISSVDCLILCTDGAQDILYEGNHPHGRALIPMLSELSRLGPKATDYIERILGNEAAAGISGDDKTFCLIATSEFLNEVTSVTSPKIAPYNTVRRTEQKPTAVIPPSEPSVPFAAAAPKQPTDTGGRSFTNKQPHGAPSKNMRWVVLLAVIVSVFALGGAVTYLGWAYFPKPTPAHQPEQQFETPTTLQLPTIEGSMKDNQAPHPIRQPHSDGVLPR
jgi:serine/threonine protein phosphatase PrpC